MGVASAAPAVDDDAGDLYLDTSSVNSAATAAGGSDVYMATSSVGNEAGTIAETNLDQQISAIQAGDDDVYMGVASAAPAVDDDAGDLYLDTSSVGVVIAGAAGPDSPKTTPGMGSTTYGVMRITTF